MQKLGLTNNTSQPLEVYVEVNPDRYVLQPKDEMLIEGEDDPHQPHFHVNVCEGISIQVYPPLPVRVTINGLVAKPEWDTSKRNG